MKQYTGNQDFRGRPVVRSLPANAEDTGSNPCLTSYLPQGQLAWFLNLEISHGEALTPQKLAKATSPSFPKAVLTPRLVKLVN